MNVNERQRNNERLARLCGLKQDMIRWRRQVSNGESWFIDLPDFYEDTPNGAYWREKARIALCSHEFISRWEEAHWEEGCCEILCEPTLFRIPCDKFSGGNYIHVHNTAILAVLDNLEETANV